ncbi:MAG: bifunctional oligoribonuclease/PAP phosphatase NrnA [Bacteroidota bacterium]
MNSFNLINDIIQNNNKFVITTHVNPDGDAIGSELALARYLEKLGKEVRIINHSPTPQFLLFLLGNNEEIELFDSSKHAELISSSDVIFSLDLNQLSRAGSMEEELRTSKAKKVCIDHHEFPEEFADVMLIDTNKSSTGEIIYNFLINSNFQIDYDVALPLYVAIITDTGSFRFDRTTPDVHRLTAQLLETGIDPKFVYREVYEQGTANRIQLLGIALSSLTIADEGKISYMVISKSDLTKTETDEEDVEGFVNYNLTIKGVEVGIFFFEMDDVVKVSFRSVKKVPVNELAKRFNGGGHFHAAGARIHGLELKSAIEKVLNEANKFVKEYK